MNIKVKLEVSESTNSTIIDITDLGVESAEEWESQ